jgi:preprotein translocase subunit SecE
MGVRISPPVHNQFEVCSSRFEVQPPTSNLKPQTSNMNKVSIYFRDSYKELLEKVTWPNWTQLQQSTMIVLGATLFITAIVWVMDFIALGGLNLIYKFF